jgi:hypothetical protein
MPREKSIINVDTLRGLGTDAAEKIAIVGSTGTRAELGRSDMTALIAELQITVAESRETSSTRPTCSTSRGALAQRIQQIRQFLKRDGARNLYLREQVAYLFERYCPAGATAMLLCIGPSNRKCARCRWCATGSVDARAGIRRPRAAADRALFPAR